jgi:hypothetical protein
MAEISNMSSKGVFLRSWQGSRYFSTNKMLKSSEIIILLHQSIQKAWIFGVFEKIKTRALQRIRFFLSYCQLFVKFGFSILSCPDDVNKFNETSTINEKKSDALVGRV